MERGELKEEGLNEVPNGRSSTQLRVGDRTTAPAWTASGPASELRTALFGTLKLTSVALNCPKNAASEQPSTSLCNDPGGGAGNRTRVRERVSRDLYVCSPETDLTRRAPPDRLKAGQPQKKSPRALRRHS